MAGCVRSGFCCRTAPCPFGTWDAEAGQCEHLVGDRPGEYACGIHDQIKDLPGAGISPAFGTGCCSPLFNRDRALVLKSIDKLIKEERKEKRRTSQRIPNKGVDNKAT